MNEVDVAVHNLSLLARGGYLCPGMRGSFFGPDLGAQPLELMLEFERLEPYFEHGVGKLT